VEIITLRKFAPIDREYSIYEVLQGEDVLVDLTMSETGKLELAFHESCKDHIVPLQGFLNVIDRARLLLQEEIVRLP
jgi:hypothetical protein